MTPEEAFQAAIARWPDSLFTDTPQGRSLFAFGAAFVLKSLEHNPLAWDLVREEMVEFTAMYMAESGRRNADPRMIQMREALDRGEWPKISDWFKSQ